MEANNAMAFRSHVGTSGRTARSYLPQGPPTHPEEFEESRQKVKQLGRNSFEISEHP